MDFWMSGLVGELLKSSNTEHRTSTRESHKWAGVAAPLASISSLPVLKYGRARLLRRPNFTTRPPTSMYADTLKRGHRTISAPAHRMGNSSRVGGDLFAARDRFHEPGEVFAIAPEEEQCEGGNDERDRQSRWRHECVKGQGVHDDRADERQTKEDSADDFEGGDNVLGNSAHQRETVPR